LEEVQAKLKKYYDKFENDNYDKDLFADGIAVLKGKNRRWSSKSKDSRPARIATAPVHRSQHP
jgi:hypothetical protein